MTSAFLLLFFRANPNPMNLSTLTQQHLKERIAFERAKQKAFKHLQQQHKAVLSVFEKGEKIPASLQQRLQTEVEKLTREWAEDGPRFRKLMEKQKNEREKLSGRDTEQ